MKQNTPLIEKPRTPPTTGRSFGRARGFTIIELMITLTVAAILLAIAIPSFTYLSVSSKLTAAANEVITATNLGRVEAIKRNARIVVNNNNNFAVTLDSDGTVIRSALTIFNPPITLAQSAMLTFTPEGLAVDAANAPVTTLLARITSNAISSDNARCIYIITGSTLQSCTETVAAGGACPQTACAN